MDFYRSTLPNYYMDVLSINSVSNILTMQIPFGAFNFQYKHTPYDLLANPPASSSIFNDPFSNWIEFGAVYRVNFYNANGLSGNIQAGTVYFVRAITSNTCKVYATLADAFASANAISLAGFNGGRMHFMNNNYYINPCKAYATPHQCCPELPAIDTQGVYTACTVTFKGRTIPCLLEPYGNWYYHPGISAGPSSCVFAGGIDDFVTDVGATTALAAFVQVAKTNTQIEIKVEIFISFYAYQGNTYSDSYEIFTKPLEDAASFSYSGTVTGNAFQGVTQAGYSFTTKGNISQTARLKLVGATFGNGFSNSLFYNQYDYILPTKLGLGDIDELLTFNPETRCYESALKNYYNIPGRLTVPLPNFYPLANDSKFATANSLNYAYGMAQVYGSQYGYFSWRTAVFCNTTPELMGGLVSPVAAGDFYAHGEIFGVSIAGPQVGTLKQIVVEYSGSKHAVGPLLSWSSDVEPFYKSGNFVIGSEQPGSFFSTYRLT